MAHVSNARNNRGGADAWERPPAAPIDESRLAMLRRVKHMTVEQRIELFEQLSRDAAGARGTKRVR